MYPRQFGPPMSNVPQQYFTAPLRAMQQPAISKMESRKRMAEVKHQQQKPKRRLGEKILTQRVRDLVPESQAYMDLLDFERKLDSTIMRKRLDIQEAMRKPMKTNTRPDPNAPKRKFSSFFKSLVIELDKDLYGPDTHLVEPQQYKLDPRLGRLLGIHTQTRSAIIQALWCYIKTHKLQDKHEKDYINCDRYFQQVFECSRFKFCEVPQKLHVLLHPPDPIVINHTVSIDTGSEPAKKAACYDIDVELDDTVKQQMSQFLMNTQSSQEINNLENKIYDTVELISRQNTSRTFFLDFAREPQQFINNWIVSQSRDLKTMTDVTGNPENERETEFWTQPWSDEAVARYFYNRVQRSRLELEEALSLRR